jgi:hypothetical protein
MLEMILAGKFLNREGGGIYRYLVLAMAFFSTLSTLVVCANTWLILLVFPTSVTLPNTWSLPLIVMSTGWTFLFERGFLTYQLHLFDHSIILSVGLALLAFTPLVCQMMSGILLFMHNQPLPETKLGATATTIGNSVGAGVDIMIAIGLVFYTLRTQTFFRTSTQSRPSQIFLGTFATGIFSALTGILLIILSYKHANGFTVLRLMGARIYALTVMINLTWEQKSPKSTTGSSRTTGDASTPVNLATLRFQRATVVHVDSEIATKDPQLTTNALSSTKELSTYDDKARLDTEGDEERIYSQQ